MHLWPLRRTKEIQRRFRKPRGYCVRSRIFEPETYRETRIIRDRILSKEGIQILKSPKCVVGEHLSNFDWLLVRDTAERTPQLDLLLFRELSKVFLNDTGVQSTGHLWHRIHRFKSRLFHCDRQTRSVECSFIFMYATVAVTKKYESWLERQHTDVTNSTSSPLNGKESYSLSSDVFCHILKPDEFETWCTNLASDLSSLFQTASHFIMNKKLISLKKLKKGRSLI